MNSHHAVEQILEALSFSVLGSLRVVADKSVLDECDFISYGDLNVSENQLVALEYTEPYLGMTHILKRFTSRPIVSAVLANRKEANVEITDFCHEHLSKFHICAQFHSHLTAKNHFPSFLLLRELSIHNFDFKESVLKALSLAVEKEHFPVQNQLSFRSCGSSLKESFICCFDQHGESSHTSACSDASWIILIFRYFHGAQKVNTVCCPI